MATPEASPTSTDITVLPVEHATPYPESDMTLRELAASVIATIRTRITCDPSYNGRSINRRTSPHTFTTPHLLSGARRSPAAEILETHILISAMIKLGHHVALYTEQTDTPIDPPTLGVIGSLYIEQVHQLLNLGAPRPEWRALYNTPESVEDLLQYRHDPSISPRLGQYLKVVGPNVVEAINNHRASFSALRELYPPKRINDKHLHTLCWNSSVASERVANELKDSNYPIVDEIVSRAAQLLSKYADHFTVRQIKTFVSDNLESLDKAWPALKQRTEYLFAKYGTIPGLGTQLAAAALGDGDPDHYVENALRKPSSPRQYTTLPLAASSSVAFVKDDIERAALELGEAGHQLRVGYMTLQEARLSLMAALDGTRDEGALGVLTSLYATQSKIEEILDMLNMGLSEGESYHRNL